MADVLAVKLAGKTFSWGSKDIVAAGSTRKEYLDAPRSADNGDINPLMIFLRSSWTFARETILACSN
jgi:hypothetical protein